MAYKFTDDKITFACLSVLAVMAAALIVGLCFCRGKRTKIGECQVIELQLNVPQQRARTMFANILSVDFVKKIDRGCWQDENEWNAYSQCIDEFRSQAFLSRLTKDSCELRIELSAKSTGLAESAAVAYAKAVQTIVDKTNEKAEAEGLAQLRNRVRKLQKKIERNGSDGDVEARLADALSQLKTAQEIIGNNAIIITYIHKDPK